MTQSFTSHAGSKAALLALGTAVPRCVVPREVLARWMTEALDAPSAMAGWLSGIATRAGTETRHSCTADALESPARSRFAPGRSPSELATSVERMQIYRREAVELATRAASKALDDYAEQHGGTAGQAAASLTHLIVVTCTGFFAPGLDQALATALELPADVERTVMGLMGSAAAFNGLRLASEIVHGSPAARVLVVCVELCVIHQQPGADQQPLIASSLFADGAAACLVAGANTGSGARFEVDGFYSRVEPNTPKDMQRKMDDYGVVLQLSSEIPEYLGEVAPRAVRELFGVDRRPNFWAIHPGGRAIIDRLQETFELKPEDLSASREVLRRYGNMSSSTILFVLTELRRQLESQRADRHTGVAMAFEPGLVVEMASLRYLSA